MKEIDHQRQLVLSVKAQGGYALKLSNRFTIGVPDLLVMHPLFAPCLIEVKDLGECNDIFSRQIDVTSKQRHTMERMAMVYDDSPHPPAFVVVTLMWKKARIMVPAPFDIERLSSASLLSGDRLQVGRTTGGLYDMGTLLAFANVRRVT